MAVRNWDPSPYPDPRQRKAEGGAGPNIESLRPPRTRVWSGLVANMSGAAALVTVVSPKLLGPALIRELSIRHGISNALGEQTKILLLVSDDGTGQGTRTYGTAPPSGTPITDTSFFASATLTNTSYPQSLYDASDAQVNAPYTIPLRYLVTAPEFFVKLAFACPNTGTIRCEFSLSIYEAIDPDTLIDLMA